jgi:hypothetical protein
VLAIGTAEERVVPNDDATSEQVNINLSTTALVCEHTHTLPRLLVFPRCVKAIFTSSTGYYDQVCAYLQVLITSPSLSFSLYATQYSDLQAINMLDSNIEL